MSKKKSLSPEEIVTQSTVSRRAAVGLIGGIALGAGALTLGTTGTAHAIAGCTDSDPSDPYNNGSGSGCSDSDPRDPGGCGRHC